MFSGESVASVSQDNRFLALSPEAGDTPWVSPAVHSFPTSSLVPPRLCYGLSHPHPGYLHSTGEAQKGTKAQRGEVTRPQSHSEEMARLGFEPRQLDSSWMFKIRGALGDEAVGFWGQGGGTAVGPCPIRPLLSSD